MIGSITLTRQIGSNTTSFFTFGYYDTERELSDAVYELCECLTKLKTEFDVNYYVRKDGYIAYYITLK